MTGRGQGPAIRAEGKSINSSLVPGQGKVMTASFQVDQGDHAVLTRDGEGPTIRAEGHGADLFTMEARQREADRSVSRFADRHPSSVVSRGDQAAVGTERHAGHLCQ